MNYKNKDLSPRERAQDLLGRLTLEEKILQLASYFPNGIKRLDVPNIQAGECLHGIASPEGTSFPQAIALGATWNPDVVEEASTVIGREARALGVHHCYTPMLGVLRDIRWGRTEEGYGEDPYLVGKIGVGFINGLQGKGEERFSRDRVIATAKHFVADAEPLSGNNGAAVEISERSLREVHLVPFEMAVKEAHVGGIMPAHHSINGVPCHANGRLINGVLRDEYGFDGMVVTDNGDVRGMKTLMSTAKDLQEAAVQALNAGVDCELAWMCPMGDNRAFGTPLLNALKEGTVTEETLNNAILNVLTSKFKLGLFDDEEEVAASQAAEFFEFQGEETGDEHIHYADTMRSFGVPRKDCHDVLYAESANVVAKKVADQSIILLKNDNNLLPLDSKKISTLGVIGPNADAKVLGGYSTRQPRYYVKPLDGIKNLVGDDCEILYAQGCESEGFKMHDKAEAVEVAKKSDVVVMFMGGNEMTCKENQDIDFLDFVGDQEELIQAVYAENKNVVLVLLHGRPNSIVWEKENIPAIIEGFYLGQETGNALADAIFGKTNPGGKLPLTIPRNVGQCPAFYNKLPFGRAQNYYESDHTPLYEFGFGMSYTTFDISEPVMESKEVKHGDTAKVTVTVTNTGDRCGDEVVQLYIHDDYATLTRPCKELKGFKRIHLAKGESKEITFELDERALSFYLDDKWVCEKGQFTVMVGNSSENLKTTTFDIV